MTQAETTTRRVGWAVPMALYLLGIFMGAIDTGIITPARPIVARDLGVDEAAGIWMITIYTLAYAASIPIMGKLADRQGRKPVYLVAIVMFGVGSLLCGLAQDVGSFEMLIAARALQAVGGGGILPIATAEIGTSVPESKRGMALGLVGAVYGIANIFGASAGSLILDIVGSENWQWIFYVNVPIAIAIVLAGWRLLPNHREGEAKPIDVLGTLLLVAIILSLLYGIKNIDFFDLGTSLQDPSVWPFLVGCLVALPLFVLAERRAVDPVLNLHYFTDRGIGLTLLLSLLSGVVLMAVVFVPQLAENALGIPSGKGGYFVIVLGFASGIGAPLSGKLTDRFGPRVVLGFGMAASAVAAACVVWWTIPHPSLASVIVSLALIGLGLGFVVGSPLNYMMLERTPKAESTSALGTLSLVRSIGTTLAPAIMVGFIANGAASLQTDLMAELPDTVTVPTLPYAQELTTRINAWKADADLADKLGDFELPDLTRTEITIDTTGTGDLPDDLVDLLKTADVTNVTERSKTVAQRMFEETTPSTVADIKSGVDKGIGGVTSGLAQLATARQEMTDGLAEMDTGLAEMATGLQGMDDSLADMDKGVAGMDASLAKMAAGIKGMDSQLAEMTKGIAGMDSSLADMTKGIAGMDAQLAEMASGIKGMDEGLAGLDAAIAGMKPPIAALDQAIAGMDASLAQLQQQLADLEASEDPTAVDDIVKVKAAIQQVTAQRDEAVTQREPLVEKLAATQKQRDDLAGQRAQLAAGQKALTAERTKLASAHSALAAQRKKLAEGHAALSAERVKLAQGRKALVGERDKLVAGIDALGAERAKLAASRNELSASRDDLSKARDTIDGKVAEMEDTIVKLGVLRDAVPGAFDEALSSYLAEIDARGPRLEAVFAAGVANGFRGVYLFDLAVCLVALLVIAAVPKVRPDAAASPDPTCAEAVRAETDAVPNAG